MKVKIIIVDDHQMILNGLRSMLSKAQDIEIIGESSDSRSAVDLAVKLKPDVIIMDLSMPEMSGFKVTQQILQRLPDMKVLALSMHSDRWNVQRALNTGMSGYLLKNCTSDELSTAIRTVFADSIYVSKAIAPFWDSEKPESN
jgi:DNA-binding NarL/FixJ family response regulator